MEQALFLETKIPKRNACQGADANDDNGMELFPLERHTQHHRQQYPPNPGHITACGSKDRHCDSERRTGNEAHHRRLQATHNSLHPLAPAESLVAPGNDQNHHKAW